MTLILTRSSKDYVLQVTDRLLTWSNGKEFDVVANKNVLYRARNGIVALAYTGLAYIAGVPTDQWIAETISGITFDRDRKPPAFSTGPVHVPDVGQSLIRLQNRLQAAPVDRSLLSYWEATPFEIVLAGWQWSKRRCRPVVGRISKPAKTMETALEYLPRYWHWDRSQEGGFKYTVVATPDSNLSLQASTLVSGLANCFPDTAESIMHAAIQEVSSSLPQVGPHCMSILIPTPSNCAARIRYLPSRGTAFANVTTAEGHIVATSPAAFTPWIVGPGLVMAPSVLAGEMSLVVDGFTVILEVPKLGDSSIQGALSSQQRPRMPRGN